MPAICSRHSLSNSTSWLHNALQVEQSCFVLHRKFATEPAIDRVGLQIVHAIAKAFIGVHDSAIPPQAPISEINDVAIQA